MSDTDSVQAKLGLIAGNGRFPFLVIEEALQRNLALVVAAIREEAEPELEAYADNPRVCFQWLGLGQLGRLLKLFRRHGVRRAVMAGQVRHNKVFASGSALRKTLAARPDWRMMRLLMSLPEKSTSALIGAVAEALGKAGVELIDSTALLPHLLPEPGVLTRRRPSREEQRDIDYGRPLALQIAHLDLGQTIVVRNQAVVAIEAMEGTDETIQRASRLAGGEELTVIKVSRPQQDMRFDVPVLGSRSLEVFAQCRVSALAIDAGRTLLLDREDFLRQADDQDLTIVAFTPED